MNSFENPNKSDDIIESLKNRRRARNGAIVMIEIRNIIQLFVLTISGLCVFVFRLGFGVIDGSLFFSRSFRGMSGSKIGLI